MISLAFGSGAVATVLIALLEATASRLLGHFDFNEIIGSIFSPPIRESEKRRSAIAARPSDIY